MDKLEIENYVGDRIILKNVDKENGRLFKTGEIEERIKDIFNHFGLSVNANKYEYFTEQIYLYDETYVDCLEDLKNPYVFNDLSLKSEKHRRMDNADIKIVKWCGDLSRKISSDIFVELEKNQNFQQFMVAKEQQKVQDKMIREEQLVNLTQNLNELEEGRSLK